MRLTTTLALAAALLATPAMAQVMDSKTAKGQLFSGKGYGLQISSALSKGDQATIKALIPLMAEQLRTPIRYYSAIAYNPEDGLVSESLQAAMNYHSTDAAAQAAVRACEGAKASRTPCRVAAQIVPKGYKQRPFTMSQTATLGFASTYLREKGPKSLAMSATTGAWGIGAGDAAAIAKCAEDGARDCQVRIRD